MSLSSSTDLDSAEAGVGVERIMELGSTSVSGTGDPDDDGHCASTILSKTMSLKELGNAHFGKKEWDDAARCYQRGTSQLKKLKKDVQVKALLVSMQTNLSMAFYKQDAYHLSCDAAGKALDVDPDNVKALYRRGVAYRKMGDYDGALADLSYAARLDPENVAVRKDLVAVKKEKLEASERKGDQRKFLKKGFDSKMNSHTSELIDHIRSGPTKLIVDKPLCLPHSNPCELFFYLQALQCSKTIRTIICKSHQELSISEDEWVLLVKTLGRIKDIDDLSFYCSPGSSRDFHPFQAVAEALNSARSSLRKLSMCLESATFVEDPSGQVSLANALQEQTCLQFFFWAEHGISSGPEAAVHVTARDPLFRVLQECPHLRQVTIMTKYASTDAMRYLLHQLKPATELRFMVELDQWLAVADEIFRGRCNIEKLALTIIRVTRSEATEAIKAVASAIQMDHNVQYLYLQLQDGFTDEAGVALAEALTINRTLRKMVLNTDRVMVNYDEDNKAILGAKSFEAFAAMLRINTSVTFAIPTFDDDNAIERETNAYAQMCIEIRLNEAGRGRLLASRQTPREEWVNALNELNSPVDDCPEFGVSCVYGLLRLKPSELFVGTQ
jgi:tetratricopeptide (TPR) repeat protein